MTWHQSDRPVDFAVPPLNAVIAYRGVYALCELVGKRPDFSLRATYYTACLMTGPQPIWGVWTVAGRFVRFFGRRAQIVEAYPKHVWRRKQATWSMVDVHDKDEAERRAELGRLYHKGGALTGSEVPKVLAERDAGGNVVPLRKGGAA